jgi:hypothetical protein
VSWFFFVPQFYNTQNSNFVSVRHDESTNSHAARFHAYLAPVRRERERDIEILIVRISSGFYTGV